MLAVEAKEMRGDGGRIPKVSQRIHNVIRRVAPAPPKRTRYVGKARW
jgi:hypothetical protein